MTDARGVSWRDRAAVLPGDCLWTNEPRRGSAAAFVYFALLGWSELYGRRTFGEPNPRAVEPTGK